MLANKARVDPRNFMVRVRRGGNRHRVERFVVREGRKSGRKLLISIYAYALLFNILIAKSFLPTTVGLGCTYDTAVP
jgi:hypothetical protein